MPTTVGTAGRPTTCGWATMEGVGILDRLRGDDGDSGTTRRQIVDLAMDTEVAYDERSWRVVGHLRFDEEGFRWVEHRMVTEGGRAVWLAVDEGRGSTAIVWTDLDPAGVQGAPTSSVVQHYGRQFRRAEDGVARFTAVGDTETPADGRFEYADFHGEGGHRLSFEKYTGADGRGLRRPVGGPCEHCGAPQQDSSSWRCLFCRAARRLSEAGPPAWEVAGGVVVPLAAVTLP